MRWHMNIHPWNFQAKRGDEMGAQELFTAEFFHGQPSEGMGSQKFKLFNAEFSAKRGDGVTVMNIIHRWIFLAKRGDEIEGGNALLNVIFESFYLNITIFSSPWNCNILAFCSRNYFDHYRFSGEFFSPASYLGLSRVRSAILIEFWILIWHFLVLNMFS